MRYRENNNYDVNEMMSIMMSMTSGAEEFWYQLFYRRFRGLTAMATESKRDVTLNMETATRIGNNLHIETSLQISTMYLQVLFILLFTLLLILLSVVYHLLLSLRVFWWIMDNDIAKKIIRFIRAFY